MLVNGCEKEYIEQIDDYIYVFYIKNIGKANALNIGVKYAKYDLICVLDVDCVLEDDSISNLLNHLDLDVYAIGGRLKTLGDKHNILAFIQRLEYMRAFNVTRPIFNYLGSNPIISGAYGLFRKDGLSFDTSSVGEDMEVVLSLNRENKKILYAYDSVCYTRVPENFKRLIRQRDRWQRGLLDCLIKHKSLILNPKYKCLGLVVLPYIVLFELLGPVFILLGLVFFNIYVYLFCLLIETIVTLIAEYIEYRNIYILFTKLPEIIIGTFLLSLFSIVLAQIRLYGMITYPKRKSEW